MSFKIEHSTQQTRDLSQKPLSSTLKFASAEKASSASSIRYCFGTSNPSEETNAKDSSKQGRSCFNSLIKCIKAIKEFFISIFKGVFCCHFCSKEKKIIQADKKEIYTDEMWEKENEDLKKSEESFRVINTWFSSTSSLAKGLADVKAQYHLTKTNKDEPSCKTASDNSREFLELLYFREEGRKSLNDIKGFISPKSFALFTKLLSGNDKNNVEAVKKFKSLFNELLGERQEEIKSKRRSVLKNCFK